MKIFGILNITNDSFSDGGLYLEKDKSLAHADQLISEGAWAVDLGAQSSNPDADLIPAETEWERLKWLIYHLKQKQAKISVDTFRPEVLDYIMQAGVDFINNINAFQNDAALEVLQSHRNQLPELIVMHSASGTIAQRKSKLQPKTIVDEILRFFDGIINRLLNAGIPKEKIIFDPGMGFFLGPDPMLSIRVLQNIDVLREKLGPIMVSVSRKSFIGALLGEISPGERRAGTLVCESWMLMNTQIDYIRTHDVLQLKQAYTILKALKM